MRYCRWQPLALLEVALRAVAAPDAVRRRMMAWYRIAYAAPARQDPTPAQADLAVYIPRAIAGPVQVRQLQGEHWLKVFDNREARHEQWNRPLLVRLLAQASLILAIGAPIVEGRFHAISSVWVGPHAVLRERAGIRWALQITVPEAASLAMGALALLSLGVWLWRRAEVGYLHFGLAAMALGLRNLHAFVDLPQDPVANEWFWWMSKASMSWLMLMLYLFAFRFDARRYPKLERGFAVFVVAGSLLTIPAWPLDTFLLQHGLNLAAAFHRRSRAGRGLQHRAGREAGRARAAAAGPACAIAAERDREDAAAGTPAPDARHA